MNLGGRRRENRGGKRKEGSAWRGAGNGSNSAICASVILIFASVTMAFLLNSGLVCPTLHSHLSFNGNEHVTANMSKLDSCVPRSSLYLTRGTVIPQCSGPKQLESFSPAPVLGTRASVLPFSMHPLSTAFHCLHWLWSWYKSLLPVCMNALLLCFSLCAVIAYTQQNVMIP